MRDPIGYLTDAMVERLKGRGWTEGRIESGPSLSNTNPIYLADKEDPNPKKETRRQRLARIGREVRLKMGGDPK